MSTVLQPQSGGAGVFAMQGVSGPVRVDGDSMQAVVRPIAVLFVDLTRLALSESVGNALANVESQVSVGLRGVDRPRFAKLQKFPISRRRHIETIDITVKLLFYGLHKI